MKSPASADPRKNTTGLERITNDTNHVQISGFSAKGFGGSGIRNSDKLDTTLGAGMVSQRAPTARGVQTAVGQSQQDSLLSGLMRKGTELVNAGKKTVSDAATAAANSPKVQFAIDHPVLAKIYMSLFSGTGKSTSGEVSRSDERGGDSISTSYVSTGEIATSSRVFPKSNSKSIRETTASPLEDQLWWQDFVNTYSE